MIYVGTDIIEISRLNKFIQNYPERGLSHIFTPAEVKYCTGKRNAPQHFAGRFAGKEAVKKAILSAFPEIILPLSAISISNQENGAPFVTIDPGINIQLLSLQISISHSDTNATAVAILET